MKGKLGSFSEERNEVCSDLEKDLSMIVNRKVEDSMINDSVRFEIATDVDYITTGWGSALN
jgi:hypothetical protein